MVQFINKKRGKIKTVSLDRKYTLVSQTVYIIRSDIFHGIDKLTTNFLEERKENGLIQIPHDYFKSVVSFDLPEMHSYAVGIAFLPTTKSDYEITKNIIIETAKNEDLTILGWREVPTDPSTVGITARSVMPKFEMLFIQPKNKNLKGIEVDRAVYPFRKIVENNS